MQKPFLEVGEFVAVHGIGGELRLYPWCDSPDFVSRFQTLYADPGGHHLLEVVLARPHKNLCLVKLAGVDTPEAARRFVGQTVYIARRDAALPAGRYFIQDILGAAVRDADTGEVYGKIKAVTHPGRHDVYEIERPDGSTVLFPAADAFVAKLDVENGLVDVRPIAGMFDGKAAGGGDDAD